jgi:hypothetical protein
MEAEKVLDLGRSCTVCNYESIATSEYNRTYPEANTPNKDQLEHSSPPASRQDTARSTEYIQSNVK